MLVLFKSFSVQYNTQFVVPLHQTLMHSVTVGDCLQTLDTEYRDGVHESLMQWDDELSVVLYGKTFKQYEHDIEEKFKKFAEDKNYKDFNTA